MAGGARTGVRVRRVIATSVVAAALSSAVVAASAAAPLPDVGVPSAPSLPPVTPPPVPAVPAPVPAPVPVAPLPVPISPAPSSPPAVGQLPAQTLGRALGTTVETVAAGSAQAIQSGARRAAAGDSGRPSAQDRRSRRLHAVRVYRKHQRMVRRLRGCLDELAPMRGRLLVLRYGIGRARPRSAAYVARVLGVSRRRYAKVRVRALRALVQVDRSTGCRHTRTVPSLLVFASAGSGMGAQGIPATTTLASTTSSTAGGEREESAVLGESATGGAKDGERDSEAPSLSPPLADSATRIPLLVAIVALVCALAMWFVARRRRTAGSYPYEDPNRGS